MKNNQITVDLDPEESTRQKIRQHLRAYNEAKIGVYKAKPFAVMARAAPASPKARQLMPKAAPFLPIL
jgi:hypothetical protein